MAADAAFASGLSVAVLLVLAACGGAGSGKTTIVTVTNVKTVTSAQPPGSTEVPATARRYARFRMPSRNVGCTFDSGVLRCDILSGLVPEPSGSCELDWTGFALESTGEAEPVCAGDTVYDADAPVLAYGELWWSGKSIVCHSLTIGLQCANAAGHGFSLARGASRSY